MIDIPTNWKTALRAVQSAAREAVIAGGCLRDLDNKRPVKDIDIFVRGHKADQLMELRENLLALGFDSEPIDTSTLYPVGDGNDVVGFFEAYWDGIHQPIQIIMVNFDCSRICERFDYGLCRLSFDGRQLMITEEYRADKDAQLFQLRRPRTGGELVASIHRYARFSRKYDGWKFALYEEPDDVFSGL